MNILAYIRTVRRGYRIVETDGVFIPQFFELAPLVGFWIAYHTRQSLSWESNIKEQVQFCSYSTYVEAKTAIEERVDAREKRKKVIKHEVAIEPKAWRLLKK